METLLLLSAVKSVSNPVLPQPQVERRRGLIVSDPIRQSGHVYYEVLWDDHCCETWNSIYLERSTLFR